MNSNTENNKADVNKCVCLYLLGRRMRDAVNEICNKRHQR